MFNILSSFNFSKLFSKMNISSSSNKENTILGIERHFRLWFSDEKMWYEPYNPIYVDEIENFRDCWLFSNGHSIHFDNKYNTIDNPTQLRVALNTFRKNLNLIKNYKEFDRYI